MTRVKKAFPYSDGSWDAICPFCYYNVSYSERSDSIDKSLVISKTQDCKHSIAIKTADGGIAFMFDDQGLL